MQEFLEYFFNNQTIARYLECEIDNILWNNLSCIVLPYLQFGAKVESDKESISKGIPKGYNTSMCNTLKYFTTNINEFNNSINSGGKW